MNDIQPPGKSPLRFLPPVARVLMGLVFFVFGLNGFFHFMPEPKEAMPEGATALMTGFLKSGYMMPLISGTETLVGLLLLINCFVPLALAFIAPVIVNIICFHLVLMPSTIVPGIVVLVLELYLAWAYRQVFKPMLAWRVKPRAGGDVKS
jgi:uncharacterized membrane protein YphA (DoxX/SURF4 family)